MEKIRKKRTPALVTIDGEEMNLAELGRRSGLTEARLYNWFTGGYFDSMIPAIKREMEKNKNEYLRR